MLMYSQCFYTLYATYIIYIKLTFYTMDFCKYFSSSIEYQILIQLKVHLMHFNQGQISPVSVIITTAILSTKCWKSLPVKKKLKITFIKSPCPRIYNIILNNEQRLKEILHFDLNYYSLTTQ